METVITHRTGLERTEIASRSGAWLSTLTERAHTVTLAGLSRTFAEASASDVVTHAIWVRALPQPCSGHVNSDWIESALAASTTGEPDVLAIAMRYVKDAPPIAEGGLVIAGAARHGPPGKDKDGKIRPQEGVDFNDYLGIPWTYPDKVDQSYSVQKPLRAFPCQLRDGPRPGR